MGTFLIIRNNDGAFQGQLPLKTQRAPSLSACNNWHSDKQSVSRKGEVVRKCFESLEIFLIWYGTQKYVTLPCRSSWLLCNTYTVSYVIPLALIAPRCGVALSSHVCHWNGNLYRLSFEFTWIHQAPFISSPSFWASYNGWRMLSSKRSKLQSEEGCCSVEQERPLLLLHRAA